MVRDFTKDTKERLLKEIDDINKSTWNPVTDAVGDVFMYAGKWLGIISLDDDMKNVESYQRNVLDMSNTTKEELKQIFEDVYDIDKEYKSNFADLVEREDTYNNKLQYLHSKIKPNFSICSAAEIREGVASYNEKLKAVDKKINKTFNKELDWAAKQAALEHSKGLLNNLVMLGVDILTLPVSMVKNVVTGNPIGIFTDTWNLIDDFFSFCGSGSGLIYLGLGYGITHFTGNLDDRHDALKDSETYIGVTGLTEMLEADEEINGKNFVTSGLRWVSQKVDTVSGVASWCSDIKGFLDDPKKLKKFDGWFDTDLFESYDAIKKSKMADEFKDDWRKWQKLYRDLYNDNHIAEIKNASKIYKFFNDVWGAEDSDKSQEAFLKEIWGKVKPYEILEDGKELGEDVTQTVKDIYNLGKYVYDYVF